MHAVDARSLVDTICFLVSILCLCLLVNVVAQLIPYLILGCSYECYSLEQPDLFPVPFPICVGESYGHA